LSAATLSALGFNVPRLGYMTRTAAAACLALYLAWLVGLEHPQWSAMTVWASSQPLRGQLLERSFFRMAGTVIGTIAGVLLVVLAGNQPLTLVIGLALWVGLCAGIGNLQRSYVSYGTMLAGYSAGMVALLDTAHPDRVLVLGSDRLLTVLLGVLTALGIGLLFAPRQSPEDLNGRVRSLTARVLRAMALRLRGESGTLSGEPHAILSEMAAIEEALDPHAAGSLRSRRAARAIRALLAAQAAALVWLRGSDAASSEPAVSLALDRTAAALEGAAGADEIITLIEEVAREAGAHPPLREVVLRLETALRDQFGAPAREGGRPPLAHPVILHRDWVVARQAAIRAGATMLVLGLFWVVTGWTLAPYMMLGASIMLSVFSTFDNPARSVWYVALGQFGGVIAALLCRWLVWPHAGSEMALVFLAMPFILSGAPLMAHQRTAPGAYDYNMAMLLMLQPAYPLTLAFWPSVAMAGAVVAGPLAGLAAYKLIFPIDARRRMDILVRMMVGEVAAMAANRNPADHRLVWRARLFHRMLRLIRWAEKTNDQKLSTVDGSLAVLTLGEAVLRLRALLRDPDVPSGAARGAKMALGRVAGIVEDPVRAQHALDRATRRLAREARPEAAFVHDAARALTTDLAFFRRAAGSV
jgi:uncharacterized membrane protein YccC